MVSPRTAAILMCCVLGGCATVNPMAFSKNDKTVNVAAKSVVLMSLDVSRPDDSRYEPVPFVVKLERPGAASKAERQNFKISKNADSIRTAEGHNLFLLRMALEPGPYRLMVVDGFARAFPFNGIFEVPLITDLSVQEHAVVYAGRVTATLRKKTDDDFRAGPVIPLIDQAATGISGSTWDVWIEDRADNDLPLFQQTFPALGSASIIKAPLPPYDRAAAKRWWDNLAPRNAENKSAAMAPAATVGH